MKHPFRIALLSALLVLAILPAASSGFTPFPKKDAPHKNRAKAKEFHGLYVEMEKRARSLQATLQAGDLPKAGIVYGRILEVCASCHGKFRD